MGRPPGEDRRRLAARTLRLSWVKGAAQAKRYGARRPAREAAMRAMGASAESGPRRRGVVRWAAWIATFAATSLGGLLVFLARRPRGDRDWAEEFARTTTARFNPDGTVTLMNI